jgi:hypothetical protein
MHLLQGSDALGWPQAHNNQGDPLNRIAILIDKSGSMAPLRKDTIGGFNTWLQGVQGSIKDKCSLDLVLFDTEQNVVFAGANLSDIEPFTDKDYVPDGGTALNDALGDLIERMKKRSRKDDRVLFLIITDGEENSSKRHKLPDLKVSIEKLTAKGWEFQYIGANVNAFLETARYGFTGTTQYYATGASTGSVYTNLTNSTVDWSGGATLGSTMTRNIGPDGTATPKTNTKTVKTPVTPKP